MSGLMDWINSFNSAPSMSGIGAGNGGIGAGNASGGAPSPWGGLNAWFDRVSAPGGLLDRAISPGPGGAPSPLSQLGANAGAMNDPVEFPAAPPVKFMPTPPPMGNPSFYMPQAAGAPPPTLNARVQSLLSGQSAPVHPLLAAQFFRQTPR